MSLDVVNLDVQDGGIDVPHARVRNHNVQVVNVMSVMQFCNGVMSVLLNAGVESHDDELGVGACGKLVQGLGSCMVWVAHRRNDDMRRFRQVTFHETESDAPVGTCDQNDCFGYHGVLMSVEISSRTVSCPYVQLCSPEKFGAFISALTLQVSLTATGTGGTGLELKVLIMRAKRAVLPSPGRGWWGGPHPKD